MRCKPWTRSTAGGFKQGEGGRAMGEILCSLRDCCYWAVISLPVCQCSDPRGAQTSVHCSSCSRTSYIWEGVVFSLQWDSSISRIYSGLCKPDFTPVRLFSRRLTGLDGVFVASLFIVLVQLLTPPFHAQIQHKRDSGPRPCAELLQISIFMWNVPSQVLLAPKQTRISGKCLTPFRRSSTHTVL